VLHALAIVIIALTARLLFLAFLPAGAYSDDVASWINIDRILSAGGNPYNLTDQLNWPPFWVQVIFAMGRVSRATGIEFVTVLRAVLITVELCVMLLAYGLTRRVATPSRAFRLILIMLALNPVAILLVCQHGNFDVFVALCVLLAIACATRFAASADPVDWLCAAACIGIGVFVKTVPLVLTPMLAFGFRRLRWTTRILGAALVVIPAALGVGVIYVLGPSQVSANVLHYRSYSGWFGITGLLELAGIPGAGRLYVRVFETAFLVALAALTIGALRKARASFEGLVLVSLALLAAVPGLGPGYSPQYIYWFLAILPIAVGVSHSLWLRRSIWLFLGIAACTYIVEYAMFRSHGAFWARLHPTPAVLETSARWSTKAGQTRIRMPMFAAWVAMLAAVANQVIAEVL
jgi:hypothetical protein